MRILHTSDWHLGRSLHSVDLTSAHEDYFDHLVEVVDSEDVDAVLVAGDIYDRAWPPVESVRLLEDVLVRLTEKVPVVLTPGNHDSATRLGFGSRLFRDRLIIRGRPEDIHRPVVLPDADGGEGLWVYAAPFLDPDLVRHALSDSDELDDQGRPLPLARSHEAVMSAVMRSVTTDLTARRGATARRTPTVLMAHGFVTGGEACDSERDIRVGGVDNVPHAVFGGEGEVVDYVALGHLHGSQRVGPREVGDGAPGPVLRYSGSPLAFSFSEAGHTKGSLIVDFADDGSVRSIEPVAAPVKRRLAVLKGTMDELLSGRYDDRSDDWVKVTVTGDQRPMNQRATLQRAFPHLLHDEFEYAGERAALTGVVRPAQDPLEVVDDFVLQVSNAEPTADEREVLRAAYESLLAEERSA